MIQTVYFHTYTYTSVPHHRVIQFLRYCSLLPGVLCFSDLQCHKPLCLVQAWASSLQASVPCSGMTIISTSLCALFGHEHHLYRPLCLSCTAICIFLVLCHYFHVPSRQTFFLPRGMYFLLYTFWCTYHVLFIYFSCMYTFIMYFLWCTLYTFHVYICSPTPPWEGSLLLS